MRALASFVLALLAAAPVAAQEGSEEPPAAEEDAPGAEGAPVDEAQPAPEEGAPTGDDARTAQRPWWQRGGTGAGAREGASPTPGAPAAQVDADSEPRPTPTPAAPGPAAPAPPEEPALAPDEEEAALPVEEPEWPAPVLAERPLFGEEEHPGDIGDDWTLTFHGYARMPLAFHGAAERPPYLVDSDYFLSGFNYTRVAEREWAEIFLGAQHERTRFVVGLFASQLSDWSESTLQGQGGIATAFVEHTEEVTDELDLGIRAGMFWDRYGYLPHYDTYLFGRTHIAGLRGSARLFDRFYLKTGFGAHADVVSSNQGFTPVVWVSGGVDLDWIDVGLHTFHVWTSDSEREFAIIEDGSLTVLGADARVGLPHIGQLYVGAAHYDAEQVVFLANTLELLHSTGGRGLTENFFGLDSNNGTGSIVAAAFELTWEPGRTLAALSGRDAGRSLRGLELRLFSLTAHANSEQASDDPLANRDDRTYFKWGSELYYRPPFEKLDSLFAAFRYDRVVLDTDHDSMSYRLFAPRVGLIPFEGVVIFAQYARYAYGDNVSLRPNQIPGDVSVTTPDDHAFKLQAEVVW